MLLIAIMNIALDKYLKMSYICKYKLSYFCRDIDLNKMNKNKTLEEKIATRISRKKCCVVLREDFVDLSAGRGGYDQIGRVLRNLVKKGKLIKVGYGLYAKTKISPIYGTNIPQQSLPKLAREALERIGIETTASRMEKDYNAGISTQVPTGRLIAVKGRVSRKIGYNGAYVSFERAVR